jgi:hypothetical protein
MNKGLGRRIAVDPRDREYLMRRKLATADKVLLPSAKTWRVNGRSLDQGLTSTCVGHAWKNFLRCAPMQTEKSGPSPFDIYRRAVAIDPWADNDAEAAMGDWDPSMDGGTSVRAGAKVLTDLGHLKSYLWAFDLSTVVEWVLTNGPCVVGTNWYSSFEHPDPEGIVKIEPGAAVLGGHAYLLRGINATRSLATLENSWGDNWGKAGAFYMPLADLERLIHEEGEACAAVEQKMTARPQ